jgi:DNA polymerase III epsilon subunit-like protein
MAIFLDTETTGLAPTSGAVILSIAMISDDHQPHSPCHELELYITPTEEQWTCATEEALKVNGLTLNFLRENGVPLATAVDKVCTWIAGQRVWLGTDVIGQNPDFDFRFLRYFMGSNLLNMGFPIHRNPINVIDMAKELAHHDPTFKLPINGSGRPSFKGSAISQALGLPPEPEIHRALAGAHACRNNYYALLDRLNKVKKQIRFR